MRSSFNLVVLSHATHFQRGTDLALEEEEWKENWEKLGCVCGLSVARRAINLVVKSLSAGNAAIAQHFW
jgi:hypothetical protein